MENAGKTFPGKLAVLQRVIPYYRLPFFKLLRDQCAGGLSIAAGNPLEREGIYPNTETSPDFIHRVKNWHFFHPRHPLYLCWQSGLRGWLTDVDPDILIVEANPRYRSTPAAVKWMKDRGRPVLGWGLGAPPLQNGSAGWRIGARKRFLSSIDGIIAYSKRGAEEYRALGILPPDRIFVAHNAVTSPKPETVRAKPGDRGRPVRVLFVGRLQSRKRLDLLLSACSSLPESIQPVLTVVGEGPARQSTETLAQKIYPNTVFLGDRRGKELETVFMDSDLFILPGTGGLAVQEAMSYGLPIIAAQGDGTQEDLVTPLNGWQVQPGNLPDLIEKLKFALQDPEKLRMMGMESYRIVSEEINLERMVQQVIEACIQTRALIQ